MIVWLAWLHYGYGYGNHPDELLAVCETIERAKLACVASAHATDRVFMQPSTRVGITEWRDHYDPEDADDPETHREHTRYADTRSASGRSLHYRIERWEIAP